MAIIQLRFNNAIIKEFSFEGDALTIGRKTDNTVVIDNPAVSGHHARVVIQGGSYFIEDLNSTNGTFLRDRRIQKEALQNHDEVVIAKHTIVFLNEQPVVSEKPASVDATVLISPAAMAKTNTPLAKPRDVMGGLRVVSGESTASQYSLPGLVTYLGKAPQAAIRLKGFFAPNLAACIARKPEGYSLQVIKEKSVKINGQTLVGQALLKEGDLIEAGNLRLLFYLQDAQGPISG